MAYLLRIEEGGMLVPALLLLDLLTADALKEALTVIVTVLQNKRSAVAYTSRQVTEDIRYRSHAARGDVRHASCR
jgi:hypothetical protein